MDFSVAEVKKILADCGFSYSRGLGQNFLVNPSVCPRMARACGCEGIGALEIGPGAGVLTRELSKLAAKTVAVELDRRLEPVLAQTLAGTQNVEIYWGDALKLDLPAFIKEKFGDMPVVVCANLPYYISSELVMSFLEQKAGIKRITVMLQKEMAARICSRLPGRECGAISAAVEYYCEAKPLFDVSAGSFCPPPKVDSRVVSLAVREAPAVSPKDEKLFFRVVGAAFGQRRKTLSNSLGSLVGKERAAAALNAAGVLPTLRAEQLTLGGFCAIADALTETEEEK